MAEKKKIYFIINPISGVGKKNTIPPLIEKHLNRSVMEWEIGYTRDRGHGAILAKEHKDEFDAIIAVGGDGSVNEIGGALINENCALGILPCGSGNGLARHLHIPLNLDKAVQRIAAFNPIKIDSGLVNDRPFLGTCGFGFDAHIANKFDTFGKRGFISYARLVMSEYNSYQTPSFKITGNEVNFEKEAILCSIANSSQFGNGFTISPNSDIQDGIFELVFLEKFNLIKAPGITSKFFSKSIHKSKHFTSLPFKDEIEINIGQELDFHYHIDGEPLTGNGKFTVKIRPHSLTIL